MKTNYKRIFKEMSDRQAGALIKAIYSYVADGDSAAGLTDVEVKMALKFICNDLDLFEEKYMSVSEKRADAGRKGAEKTNILKTRMLEPANRQNRQLPYNDNDLLIKENVNTFSKKMGEGNFFENFENSTESSNVSKIEPETQQPKSEVKNQDFEKEKSCAKKESGASPSEINFNAKNSDVLPTNDTTMPHEETTVKKRAKIDAQKIQYAEFVWLTVEEYDALKVETGSENAVKQCIDLLDNYKGASGKTYKSDYRAIRSWVIKRLNDDLHNLFNVNAVNQKVKLYTYNEVLDMISSGKAKFDDFELREVNGKKYRTFKN
ncbi:MAG: DUF6291 domain-containing protein [Prevotellaceae bacterium]|nr:DUF6291 domain-containing protein [Prevotellaceae bacterium]